MLNVIDHLDEEYSNDAIAQLKEKTLNAEEKVYGSKDPNMQYSEPNNPILIQHDKDGSGGFISFSNILLATLFSILTIYSLLFTQVRISDAAVNGLGQEVIE